MPRVGMMPQQTAMSSVGNTTQQPLQPIGGPAPAQLPGAQMPVGGFAQNGLSNLGQLQSQPQQSPEQQALSGNKQQVSNFMNALNQVGAGTNNTFMNSQNPNMSPVTNLVDPSVAYQNNGNTGNPPTIPQGWMPPTNLPGGTQQQLNSGAVNTLQGALAGGNTAPVGGQINGANPNLGPAGQNMSGLTQNLGPGAAQPQQQPPIPQQQSVAGGMAQNGVIDPNAVVSDENLKTDIKDTSMDKFLSTVKSHSYKYKNPEIDGEGMFHGPMAQELEQTPMGKETVIETPRGKMVNTGRLTLVNTAALGVLHNEQQKLKAEIQSLRNKFNLKGKS